MKERIIINHFDCEKQKVADLIESFIDLQEDYIRYYVHGYIHQYNSELAMLDRDPKYINDDEIFAKESFCGARLHTGAQDDNIFVLTVHFKPNEEFWVRFKKESEARSVMNKIFEWAGIKIQ